MPANELDTHFGDRVRLTHVVPVRDIPVASTEHTCDVDLVTDGLTRAVDATSISNRQDGA
jgi:hypothetical protein